MQKCGRCGEEDINKITKCGNEIIMCIDCWASWGMVILILLAYDNNNKYSQVLEKFGKDKTYSPVMEL